MTVAMRSIARHSVMIGDMIGVSPDLSRLARVCRQWMQRFAAQLNSRQLLLIRDMYTRECLLFDAVTGSLIVLSPDRAQRLTTMIDDAGDGAFERRLLTTIDRDHPAHECWRRVARIDSGPARGDIYLIWLTWTDMEHNGTPITPPFSTVSISSISKGHLRVAVLPNGASRLVDCDLESTLPRVNDCIVGVINGPKLALLGRNYQDPNDEHVIADESFCILLDPADGRIRHADPLPTLSILFNLSGTVWRGELIVASTPPDDQPHNVSSRPWRLQDQSSWEPLPELNAEFYGDLEVVTLNGQLMSLTTGSIWIYDDERLTWRTIWAGATPTLNVNCTIQQPIALRLTI